MTVSTVDVLRLARDLYAQAPSHVPDPKIPENGTFCMLLATQEATIRLHATTPFAPYGHVMDRADEALRTAVGSRQLVKWNAEHSTEEVLAAFDRAIEAEQAKTGLKVEA